MEHEALLAWAADAATTKREIFLRLKESDDPDVMLLVLDGVVMRTQDDILKGVLKAMVHIEPSHFAISVEHAALCDRFDHVRTVLKTMKIGKDHLDEAIAYVATINEAASEELRMCVEEFR